MRELGNIPVFLTTSKLSALWLLWLNICLDTAGYTLHRAPALSDAGESSKGGHRGCWKDARKGTAPRLREGRQKCREGQDSRWELNSVATFPQDLTWCSHSKHCRPYAGEGSSEQETETMMLRSWNCSANITYRVQHFILYAFSKLDYKRNCLAGERGRGIKNGSSSNSTRSRGYLFSADTAPLLRADGAVPVQLQKNKSHHLAHAVKRNTTGLY